MRLLYRLCTCAVLFASLAGCDSTSNDHGGLIGTWSLIEVNGQRPTPGTVLVWEFTETTLRITSDLDCATEYTYRVSGDEIAATVTRVSGSACGDVVGDTGSVRFALNGDRLTITVDDEGDVGVFVFRRT